MVSSTRSIDSSVFSGSIDRNCNMIETEKAGDKPIVKVRIFIKLMVCFTFFNILFSIFLQMEEKAMPYSVNVIFFPSRLNHLQSNSSSNLLILAVV